MIIIDPPTPFASLEDWRAFLAEMQQLLRANPDDPDVQEAVEEAIEEVAARAASANDRN